MTMESYNIFLSDLAIQDIIDIKTYISIELGELEVSEGMCNHFMIQYTT